MRTSKKLRVFCDWFDDTTPEIEKFSMPEATEIAVMVGIGINLLANIIEQAEENA